MPALSGNLFLTPNTNPLTGYWLNEVIECTSIGGSHSPLNFSNFRAGRYGVPTTGTMTDLLGSLEISKCYSLNSHGGGIVAISNPWWSGWSYGFQPLSIYDAHQYVINSNFYPFITYNANPDSGYNFQYWTRRTDTWGDEIISYNQGYDFYLSDEWNGFGMSGISYGWEETKEIAANFTYAGMGCYSYWIDAYTNWSGIDCNGNFVYSYSYQYHTECLNDLFNGGSFQGSFCDPNCVAHDTLIEMPDGSQKLIQDIRLGDIIKGVAIEGLTDDEDVMYDWSSSTLNMNMNDVQVVGIVPILVDTALSFNSGLLKTSKDHAHLIKRDGAWLFKQAQFVQVGDFLVDRDNNEIEIISIDLIDDVKTTVYKMNVETKDTFIANGIVTHNFQEKLMPV